MKKLLVVALVVLLLTGCGSPKTYETIADEYEPQDVPTMLEVVVKIPEEAAASVMTSDDGAKLYLCDDYQIIIQTLPAGDMQGVFRKLTGFAMEDLFVIRSQYRGLDRYMFVWSAAGEGTDQVGRACILSDGNYCYALTAMAPADRAEGLLAGSWKELFDSFHAVDPGSIVDSGS